MDSLVGQVLQNRYKVIDKVAAGGMGVVYRGERLEIDRPVAIKFVHEWAAAEPQMRKRFEIEVRAMGRIHHPCCVSITDFGVHEGAPYVVMDYVDGQTLEEVIEDGPIPLERTLSITDNILAGLAHAHEKGVVHRDIKPKNIMVRANEGFGDEVRILDFGLAKLREQTTGLTVGMAIGTPSYMAPEQTLGHKVDARTDVYTVGLVLYEMLSGDTPFWAEEAHELMRMQREDTPKRIEGVSPALWSVVAKALAKDPAARYQSAAEFAAALRKVGKQPAGKGAGKPVKGDAPTIPIETPPPLAPPGATKPLSPTPAPQQPRVSQRTPLPQLPPPAAPRRRGRAGWIVAGCLVGAAVIAAIVIAVSSGDDAPVKGKTRAERPTPGKRPPATKPTPKPATHDDDDDGKEEPAETGDPIENVEKLIAAKQTGKALRRLRKLKRSQPDNARVHYLLGTLHYGVPWYSRAIQNYLDAIRLDDKYRSDETLIWHMIRLLRVPSYYSKATWVLRKHIGKPAVPYLEKLLETEKTKIVRQRARWTLNQIRGS